MQSAPVSLQHALDPVDRARADFYAVLSALYRDAPDRALLAALAAADPLPDPLGDSLLAQRWNRLIEAASAMDPDAARDEYDAMFVGVGRSEVNLHASHWLTGHMMERPLAALRTELARLGLARDPSAVLVEDHLAALFETMRILIAGRDDRRPAPVSEQKAFFDTHIDTWVDRCCDAIRTCPLANFYARVGEFTGSFMALERDSLAME